MDIRTMAHKWCNCNFDKNGGFTSKSFYCNTTNFYSYSTAYATWIDKTPGSKLMIIMYHGETPTSRQHLSAIYSAIPPEVKTISIMGFGGYYSYYRNTDCGSSWWYRAPENLLEELQGYIQEFKSSKTVASEHNQGRVTEICDDLNWLVDNRKECTVKGIKEHLDKKLLKLFNLVRKKVGFEEMIDGYNGKGTWSAYQERLIPQRKAERTRKFVEWWNRNHFRNFRHAKHLTYNQIKKLSARESVTLACAPVREEWQDLDWTEIDNRKERILDYIIGDHKQVGVQHIMKIRNRFTGQTHILWEGMLSYDNWWGLGNTDWSKFVDSIIYNDKYRLKLDIEDFKQAKDKRVYMMHLYRMAEILEQFLNKLHKWADVQAGKVSMDSLDESELGGFNEIQTRFIRWQNDEEQRRMAEEAERNRIEQERQRQEREREEKYQSYVNRGVEGYRDLYYEHMSSTSDGACKFGSEFYFGGNVLLRWRCENIIETSKGIVFTVESAHKFWKMINKWHKNPESFSNYVFKTKSGDYRANGYVNDILTAGCHSIAFCEMERMYNEILKKEAS